MEDGRWQDVKALESLCVLVSTAAHPCSQLHFELSSEAWRGLRNKQLN